MQYNHLSIIYLIWKNILHNYIIYIENNYIKFINSKSKIPSYFINHNKLIDYHLKNNNK